MLGIDNIGFFDRMNAMLVIIIYHKNRKYSQDRNVHQKQK